MREAARRTSVSPVSYDADAVVAFNQAAWDVQVGVGNEWTVPVEPEVIAAARAGNWSVVLIDHEPVPREWFPPDLAGIDVLCLASGGGQQGPVLAAAGARVTVFDNSPRQLAQDQMVAARDALSLDTVLGDMRDLGAFADASFDLVLNPVSNVFCPDLAPVWRECFRVLRPGAALLTGFMNPDIFIFDADASENRGELIVAHRLPYSDLDLDAAERERLWGPHSPIEYSHSLTAQLGGQLAAGFVITGFREAPHRAAAPADAVAGAPCQPNPSDDPTGAYMPGFFALRAIKPTA
jgi:SAM-dependent methyltransferase